MSELKKFGVESYSVSNSLNECLFDKSTRVKMDVSYKALVELSPSNSFN